MTAHTLTGILVAIWCAGWWTYLCHTTDGRLISQLVSSEDNWPTTILMSLCVAILVVLAPVWYPLVLLMTWRWR